jgi:hypothetical protein
VPVYVIPIYSVEVELHDRASIAQPLLGLQELIDLPSETDAQGTFCRSRIA